MHVKPFINHTFIGNHAGVWAFYFLKRAGRTTGTVISFSTVLHKASEHVQSANSMALLITALHYFLTLVWLSATKYLVAFFFFTIC